MNTDTQIVAQHTTGAGDYDQAVITLTWRQCQALRDLIDSLEPQRTCDTGCIELTSEACYPTDYHPVNLWVCVPGVAPFTLALDERGQESEDK